MKKANEDVRDLITNLSLKCDTTLSDASVCLVQLDSILARLARVYEQDLNADQLREINLRQLSHLKPVLDSVAASRNLLRRALENKNRVRHGFNTALDHLE